MTEEEREPKELTKLLEDAAADKPGAAEAFFQTLLRSEVYVPVKPGSQAESWKGGALPEVGEGGLSQFGFATVEYEGSECLPIFSEEEFVAHWAEREQGSVLKEFKSLIWIVGSDLWMYLNPNQEVGKEITSWELEAIREGGEEAIKDLVAALNDEPLADIEVRSANDLFPKLRQSLIGAVDIHPEIEEAFLVAVKEGGSEHERPMVGIRYSKATKPKRDYVKNEIEETAKDFESEGAAYVFVIDDLGDKSSPNHALFDEATPFYIKPKVSGTLERAKAKLKLVLGKGEEESQAEDDSAEPSS